MPYLVGVSKEAGAQRHSSSTSEAKGSSRRVVGPPLKVLPISVWSPLAQNATPSPPMREDAGDDRFRAEGVEDSLFTNAELVVGVVLSILRDSDLEKVETLCVEEAWPYHSRGPSLYVRAPCFILPIVVLMLSANSILFLGRRLFI